MYLVHSDKQSLFEIEYIEKLLLSKINQITKITIEEFKNKNINENIIIYYSDSEKEVSDEIKLFLKNFKNNYFLIHISDESLIHDLSIYKNAIYTFRGYYSPNINTKKCFTVPIGFQSGYLKNKEIDIKNKNIIWSFFGQFYNDRKNMLQDLVGIKPNIYYKIDSFMDNNAIEVKYLEKIYSETIFAPCPNGFSNPDTFRIMEVLENGCIPIVKKFVFIDYFKFVFGNHPFIVVNRWKDSKEIIKKYLNKPEELENKQLEVSNWYKVFKENLSRDVQSVIEENNFNLISQQKKYQKEGYLNLLVLFNFYYYFKLRKNKYFIKVNKIIYKLKKQLRIVLNG
tara:strand:+ start:1035 stop:2054 length:1020 start_codon:yes stop_codon:yes gene_type:complete